LKGVWLSHTPYLLLEAFFFKFLEAVTPLLVFHAWLKQFPRKGKSGSTSNMLY